MRRRAAIAVSLALRELRCSALELPRSPTGRWIRSCAACIAEALAEADCFADKYDRAVWFALMEPRLARYVKDAREREQILHNVHCEARRVDIPPELVLAVMDVESRFDRYAVSSAGAVGLMQVMPFWPRELGMTNDQLVRIDDNVRMGTTILGYYLRKERGNYQRALQRYNGSLGTAAVFRPGHRSPGLALALREPTGLARAERPRPRRDGFRCALLDLHVRHVRRGRSLPEPAHTGRQPPWPHRRPAPRRCHQADCVRDRRDPVIPRAFARDAR